MNFVYQCTVSTRKPKRENSYIIRISPSKISVPKILKYHQSQPRTNIYHPIRMIIRVLGKIKKIFLFHFPTLLKQKSAHASISSRRRRNIVCRS